MHKELSLTIVGSGDVTIEMNGRAVEWHLTEDGVIVMTEHGSYLNPEKRLRVVMDWTMKALSDPELDPC